jgi:hypothetical protein
MITEREYSPEEQMEIEALEAKQEETDLFNEIRNSYPCQPMDFTINWPRTLDRVTTMEVNEKLNQSDYPCYINSSKTEVNIDGSILLYITVEEEAE